MRNTLFISKVLILILGLTSLLSPTKCKAGDLLDSIKSNDKLVVKLKDLYRGFEILHSVTEQGEYVAITVDSSGYEVDTATFYEILDSLTNLCSQLKTIAFHDDSLHIYSTNLLDITIQSYSALKQKGIESEEFKSVMEKYSPALDTYINYISSAYSTDHFEKMDETTYWKTIDKKNYITSPAYARYEKLDSTAVISKLHLLDSMSKHTNNFQEYAIYRIDLADQYVVHSNDLYSYGDTSTTPQEKAIAIYKSVLEQHKYCLYLFEAWLKWRMVYQENNGLSKLSDIPNDMYDNVREEEAVLVLKRIAENKNIDEMCINQFLLLATHDIVRRFGDYPYGNQNTVEYHETFDSIK